MDLIVGPLILVEIVSQLIYSKVLRLGIISEKKVFKTQTVLLLFGEMLSLINEGFFSHYYFTRQKWLDSFTNTFNYLIQFSHSGCNNFLASEAH